MIVPYTIGPMTITGFTWFQVCPHNFTYLTPVYFLPRCLQGEANAAQAAVYACAFPEMVRVICNCYQPTRL
jgi:hypothetical protein